MDREHVGPVDQRPVADPGDAEDESHELAVLVEGTGDDPPVLAATRSIAAGIFSVKPAPQVSSWRATQAVRSA
jgi:hypothetical protein